MLRMNRKMKKQSLKVPNSIFVFKKPIFKTKSDEKVLKTVYVIIKDRFGNVNSQMAIHNQSLEAAERFMERNVNKLPKGWSIWVRKTPLRNKKL
jgi:hypothetical protein